MKATFLMCLVPVLLAGCTATRAVGLASSTPVSENNRGYAFSQYQVAAEDTATIVIVRDKGLVGWLSKMYFYINDEFVAKIGAGESVTLYMKPGDYQLSMSGGLNPSAEHAIEKQVLTALPGETYHYRVSVGIPTGFELKNAAVTR